MASPRKILIGLLLLLATAGAGVYVFNYYKNGHSISLPFLTPPDQQEKREKLYAKLGTVNFFNECLEVSEQIIKTGPVCSTNSAGQTDCVNLNLYFTDYIADCLSSLAIKQNSDEYCREIQWVNIACEKQKELLTESDRKQLPDCTTQIIENCQLRYLAKAPPLSKTSLPCSNFQSPEQQDRCFVLTAAMKNDPELCGAVKNASKRAECYHLFALKLHQGKFCRDGSPELNKSCLEALKILPQADPGLCTAGRLVYNSTSSEDCYLAMAVYNQDRSLCQKYQAASPLTDNLCERYIP